MKTRNGFVSNSSSSSFVCFGFALNEEDIKKIESTESYKKYDYIPDVVNELLSEEFDFHHETNTDNNILGITLAYGSDDDLSGDSVTFQQLTDMAEEIKTQVKEVFNIEVDNSRLKVFSGTKYC